jgi:hypothetical protein
MRPGFLPHATLLLALIALGAPAGATVFTGDLTLYQDSVAGLAGDSTSTTAPNVVTVPSGATTTGLPRNETLLITPTPGGIYGYFVRVRAELSALGAGSFTGTPLSGSMPLQGAMVGDVFPNSNPTPNAVPVVEIANLPLTSGGTRGVGLGGTLSVTSYAGAIWTVRGTAWTTGPAVATNVRTTPNATPTTVTLTGYDNRTAGGGGTVQLVTPIQFSLAGGNLTGTHGVLTLSFVPEPGGLLLLGAGIAGIAACAFLFPRRR